ncbi:MAG: endonuclease [Bacteroidaceae bacterium]|nr:endonuclease [Bacteroidaceae bacterium]
MNNSNRNLAVLVALLCSLCCVWADVPLQYYNSVNGKKKAELKKAFYNVISPHTRIGYSGLWAAYEKVDYLENTNEQGQHQVMDYYSDEVYYFKGNGSAVDGMNKEHVAPQSWWGGGTSIAVGNDLIQVIPSDSKANNAKGNYPLGVVKGTPSYPSNPSLNSRMKTGRNANGEMVFEPCDEYKGDFARIYFYVATCYSDVNWENRNDVNVSFIKEDYPTLKSDILPILLQWSRQDPVCEWEKTRNERAYGIQGNRNPFIDFPYLAEYIWGDSVDYAFDLYTTFTGIPDGEEEQPVFEVSPENVIFAAVPGEASEPKQVTVRMENTKDKTFTAQVDGPFELSDDPDADDEDWSKTMMLLGSPIGSSFFVRLSAQDEGSYQGAITFSTKGVKDIVVSLSAVVGGQDLEPFFEDFGKGSKSSYAAATVECSAATWLLNDALIAKDANTNGTPSVRLKGSGVLEMQTDKLGGCDYLWFYAGNYGNDTGVTLQVSYSLDAGRTWTEVATLQSFDGWQRYGFAIQQPGSIRLRFQGGGVASKRLNIDDIEMSHYDDETGIAEINNSYETYKSYESYGTYDLAGRRVTAPHKPGIYIINGKKVLVR